jgi:hypothetical protein
MYVIKLVIDREHETELCLVDELTKQNNTTMFHETIFHQCKQNQTCHRTLIHGRYWHIQGFQDIESV